ncbi:MAG: hypothetical protein M3Y48_14910 [Actinomycetota bacterium]|nr:hypothetical protein [Actinomycetota bacterium]
MLLLARIGLAALMVALDNTGPEMVIALGLLSLVLAVSGSGRLGLDHLIVRRVERYRVSTI